MRGWSFLLTIALIALVSLGCSGGNPLSPANGPDTTSGTAQTAPAQTQLWGLYDVYIDIPTQTATAVLDRSAMFAANVVTFVNNNPANLAFNIIETPIDPAFIDVDIDVSITHPFPGLTQYNGYDVMGVFMGNGHGTLKYSSKLKYAKFGTDQFMLNDPDDSIGGPDGYTRWFNRPEFTTSGVLGYTPGLFASVGYLPTATLCPYKYFADGLLATADAGEWIAANVSTHGVFTAGSQNTRNYYLRFPTPTPNVTFAYAIVANWKGENLEDHPANTPEAVHASVTMTDDIYFVDGTNKGGDFIADIDLIGWGFQPSTIIIESTVLATNYEFTAGDMTPVGGGDTYSTYHVEIPDVTPTGVTGQEYWVIAKYSDHNYKNDFGVTNLAGNDPLAAFFRFNLYVSAIPYNKPPTAIIVDPVFKYVNINKNYTLDGTTSTDPDLDPLTYSWDLNNDGIFGDATDNSWTVGGDANVGVIDAKFPVLGALTYHLKVSDGKGGEDTADGQVSVLQHYASNDRYSYTLPTQPTSGYNDTVPAAGLTITDDLAVMNSPSGTIVQVFHMNTDGTGYQAGRYTNNYVDFADTVPEPYWAASSKMHPYTGVDGYYNTTNSVCCWTSVNWSPTQPWLSTNNYWNTTYSTQPAWRDNAPFPFYITNWMSLMTPNPPGMNPMYVGFDTSNGFGTTPRLYMAFANDNTGWVLPDLNDSTDFILRRHQYPHDGPSGSPARCRPTNIGTGLGLVNVTDHKIMRLAIDQEPLETDLTWVDAVLFMVLDAEQDIEIDEGRFYLPTPVPGDSVQSYGTIPASAFGTGTPIDIECIPSTASAEAQNRLLVLVRDPGPPVGWHLEVWDINKGNNTSTLLWTGAPGTGEPFHMDIDDGTCDAHIFHDDGTGDTAVTVFLW